MNTNLHGLKFDYVMGDGMHEWTQVLIWPLYWLDKTWVEFGLKIDHAKFEGCSVWPCVVALT